MFTILHRVFKFSSEILYFLFEDSINPYLLLQPLMALAYIYVKDGAKGEISILNLAEVAMENPDYSAINSQSRDYFHILCRQPFPGPLVGGSASTKDLNKWIDERITSCESLTMDVRKGELLRLLLSLLKISCQYYGKLRSPFGADPSLQVRYIYDTISESM